MKFRSIGVALALTAAMVAVSARTGDHPRESKDRRHAAAGMQAIAVSPKLGEPGHGWQYFSDSRRTRAVVISPTGDYYYSRGEGLLLVFKTPAAA